jgi:hypothetical protein
VIGYRRSQDDLTDSFLQKTLGRECLNHDLHTGEPTAPPTGIIRLALAIRP